MIESSGLVIIKNNKILLAHPTRQKWYGSFTFPKGKIDKNENKIDTAIRETKEEVGVFIDRSLINNNEYVIEYRTKKGYLYKKVFYFIVKLNDDYKINIKVDGVEINWADFLNKEEAEKRVFWRFKEILDYID